MDTGIILIFQLIVLIFSVIIHEISHGYIAEYLGDPTARAVGRLTLNPVKHLDFFGSFLMPVSLFLLSGGSFVFGWAKPVPYNPANLKNPKSGAGKIAVAGPVSNVILALAFGLFLRILTLSRYPFPPELAIFFSFIIYINLLLAVFNLVPIPPLDGSKVLFALLPSSESSFRVMAFLERYGIVLILAFIFFGFQFITPIIDILYLAVAGRPAGF